MSAQFPFSAVVGHEEVKLALLLNSIDPDIGGVLLRGQKGSAKTTLARGLAALLPGDAPFVELPVGATEDRVVGSIDIEGALVSGRRRFHPGLLAAADGGVLYVDEVNLLPDHLVDVLLDVSASGVNRVEREGISETHASRFVLVGSMNPEEGELRPQLLDRFGLSVEVRSSDDPEERASAVLRRLADDEDPSSFAASWRGAEDLLRARLAGARPAALGESLVLAVSSLCARTGAEGLRADLVTCRAAAALAGWEGRPEATIEDVRKVAGLALSHRRRRGPFEEPGIEQSEIDRLLEELSSRPGPDPAQVDREPSVGDPGTATGEPDLAPHEQGAARGERSRPPVAAGDPAGVVAIGAGRVDTRDPVSGRRSKALSRRGRLVGDRAPEHHVDDLALVASVRAAVARDARSVEPCDLREAVREERVGSLVVLVVDASGSMGAQGRMEAAKGTVMSLLLDAYQRRDRVAFVTFRDDSAQIVLRPTGSVEVARARLERLETGGRTPLAAGIRKALELVDSTAGPYHPLLVLVSDGRATAASEGEDPVAAANDAASEVRRRGLTSVVVDVEDGVGRLGLAAEIAYRMGARYVPLDELSAGSLSSAVKEAVSR